MDTPGLIYLLPFLRYGVGRLVVDLMRAAHGAGARVHLVTGSSQGELADDPALAGDAASFCAGVAHTDLFGRDAEAMETAEDEVGRLCLEWQIDAAHAFTAVAAAAAVAHTRTVATVVGWSPEKTREQRVMDAAILRRCDIVTATSETVVDVLWQAGLERPDIRLIRQGVPIPPMTRRRRDTTAFRTLGVSAPLVERRGVDVLLRALALLPHVPIDRLVIAGTGHAEADLRRLAASLALPCGIIWAGDIPVRQFLDEVDLVIVPSRSDTLPLLLLQAMAAGVPVIATQVGGIPEAVRDGVDGLLVPPDDPVSLSLAIWSAAESPHMAHERANHARRRVIQEFTVDGMLAKYFACYEDVSASLRGATSHARTTEPTSVFLR